MAHFRTHLLTVFMATIVAACLVTHVLAADPPPKLTDIIITTSRTHLLLFTGMKNGFPAEILTRIQSGIPVNYTFEIQLEEVHSGWFDTTLVDTELVHTIRYDSIKKEYLISFSEKKGETVTTRSLDKAKRLLSEINGYPLIERKRLKPDQAYALHITAILKEKRLPLGFQTLLPFMSHWNIETDPRTIEFRY